MWFPATIVEPPRISAAWAAWQGDLRGQIGLARDDVTRDPDLSRLLAGAIAHVEARCAIKVLTQTVDCPCSTFSDLSSLPIAPVQEVIGLTCTSPSGTRETLAPETYDLRADGLDPSVALACGHRWPTIRPGSRIVLRIVAGFGGPEAVPADMVAAIMMLVGASAFFCGRDLLVRTEQTEGVGSTTYGGIVEVGGAQRLAVEALLANYRRWPLA